jgi:[acyl-carrier-protein] S-malonyltransferase
VPSGPQPTLVAGYSVGELACYGLAEALDIRSLATLARERAAAMDRAAASAPGGLMAVRGLTRRRLERLCSDRGASVAIAIDDDDFVVGAHGPALQVLQRDLAQHGAQITCLDVGVASHTPSLAAAADAFRAALERSSIAAPKRPVVAGIDGGLVTTRARAIATLAAQIARTVEWALCMDAMVERGCRVFLELGPGRALCTMLIVRHPEVEARSVDEFRSLAAAADWVRRRLDGDAPAAR